MQTKEEKKIARESQKKETERETIFLKYSDFTKIAATVPLCIGKQGEQTSLGHNHLHYSLHEGQAVFHQG